MLLGDLRNFRRLAPAFTFKGVVFCWSCSLCHKMFMAPPQQERPSKTELSRIQAEFNQHECAIQFAVSRERLKQAVVA